MQNTIIDLWCGELAPQMKCRRETKASNALSRYLEKHRNDLCECLSEKEKDIFHRFEDVMNEIMCDFAEDAFVNGFRLGMQLTVEGMRKE